MNCIDKDGYVGDSSDVPGVSIVVIGRNEGDRLMKCLQSVRDCDYPADAIELIYVDSRSEDGSPDRAAEIGAKVLRVESPRMNAAIARNTGWRRARFDLVQFLDGDTVMDPGWLKKATGRLKEDGRLGVVFGRREEERPQESFYMRAGALNWHVPSGEARHCGGDALFRRDVLEQVGGFDERLIAGEEIELSYRVRRGGHAVWRLDEPMTRHDLGITEYRQDWRRAKRSGWAYAVVAGLCWRGHERLWLWKNVAVPVEVGGWLALLIYAIATAQFWPLAVLAGLIGLRILWIATRVRHRAGGWAAAIGYGLHIELTRIPLLLGQLAGLRFLLRKRPLSIIDYKTKAGTIYQGKSHAETT